MNTTKKKHPEKDLKDQGISPEKLLKIALVVLMIVALGYFLYITLEEFSPIFISGGGGEGFVNARIVPVVYDSYGNKVYLRNDGFVDKVLVDYSMVFGTDLEFNINDGSEIINLRDDKRRHNSVISGQPLPEKLKWVDHETTDEAMYAFSREGYLKGVEKNSQGSPQAEIIYNLEIRRVQGREAFEWQ